MFYTRINAVRGLPRAFSKVAVGKTLNSQSIRSSSEVLKGQSIRPFSCSAARLDPQRLRDEWGKPSFDVAQMIHLLDHDNQEKRAKFRKILSEDPLMTPKYNITLDEERDLALKRLKKLCDQGFISVLDFRNNPLWIFAAHELAAIVDAAMAYKDDSPVQLVWWHCLETGDRKTPQQTIKGKQYVIFLLARNKELGYCDIGIDRFELSNLSPNI